MFVSCSARVSLVVTNIWGFAALPQYQLRQCRYAAFAWLKLLFFMLNVRAGWRRIGRNLVDNPA